MKYYELFLILGTFLIFTFLLLMNSLSGNNFLSTNSSPSEIETKPLNNPTYYCECDDFPSFHCECKPK